jgi:AcrR family transcriptional regulator
MSTRTYRQTRRADATERTRTAILLAARELFREDPGFDPSLEALAERAGVSTRTVIRQFGSKEGVMEAAITAGVEDAAVTRHAEPGDVAGAVHAIVTHYEGMGDEVMRWLALADRLPMVRRVTERGVETHLEWVDAVFAPDLKGLPRAARKARRATLATATDVYVWHLLRRREGLGCDATESAMRNMVEAARTTSEGEPTKAARRGAPARSASAKTARGAA